MKLSQILAFVSTVSSVAHGYSFSESMATTAPPADSVESTGLSANEENRIYGGSEADISDYPYATSLRFELQDETFCGGTLIAPQYILTAGHCIKTDEDTIIASLGSEFGAGADSGESEQIKVSEGFRHPMYNQKKHLYDVGLLKLEKPSTQKTATLCAADGSDNQVGTEATVLGWGLTENGSESDTLQGANVAVISNAECNKQYDNRITEGMMCAGNGGGKDSCNGDSGGPLVTDEGTLIGFVSWGGKCGVNAGVYTRLTFVLDYVNDILNGGDGKNFTASASASGSATQETSLSSSTAGSAASSTVTSSSSSAGSSITQASSAGSPSIAASSTEDASTETATPISSSSGTAASSTEASSTGDSSLPSSSSSNTTTTSSSSLDSTTPTSSSTGSATTEGSGSPTTESSSDSSVTQSTTTTDAPASTPAVTPEAEASAAGSAVQLTPSTSGCKVRQRRRLASIDEVEVEKDMQKAKNAKAVAEQKKTEAEMDIVEAKAASNEEELDDAEAADAAAEEEEEEAEGKLEDDEELEEQEEEGELKDAEDGEEEEAEEEDSPAIKSMKTSKETEEQEEEEEETENGDESDKEE